MAKSPNLPRDYSGIRYQEPDFRHQAPSTKTSQPSTINCQHLNSLSRRLLVGSAAGANVEPLSSTAPAVPSTNTFQPSTIPCVADPPWRTLRSVHLPDPRWTSLVTNFPNGFPSPGTTHRLVFPTDDALIGFGWPVLRSRLATAGSVSSGRPLRTRVVVAEKVINAWWKREFEFKRHG
jgi:hypothetical protein